MRNTFDSWLLKTTVFGLFLASCLGHERSIERRAIETKDIRDWNRYRYEDLIRKEVPLQNRRDDSNERLNENNRHSLESDTRRENLKIVERQIISDVTRHLGNRIDERRELDNNHEQYHYLRRIDTDRERSYPNENLNSRANERYSNDERKDYALMPRFDERQRQSDENRQEQVQRRNHLRRFDERDYLRDLNRHSNIAREIESREENRKHQDISRQQDNIAASRRVSSQTEVNIAERDDNLRRFDDNAAENSLNRRIVKLSLAEECELEHRRDENKLERKEYFDNINRNFNREDHRQLSTSLKFNSQEYRNRFDNREVRNMGRRYKIDLISENIREQEQIPEISRQRDNNAAERNVEDRKNNRRVENRSEKKERLETSRRFDYHEVQRDNRKLERNHETSRRFDDIELLQNTNNFISERKYGLLQRNEENNRRDELSKDNRESLRITQGVFLKEHNALQSSDKNNQGRNERHESLKRFDSRREYGRLETATRFEDRKDQYEENRREKRHDILRRLNEGKILSDITRRTEHEDQQKTVRRFADQDTQFDKRFENTYNAKFVGEDRSELRESVHQHDDTRRERVERRLDRDDYRKTRRDASNRLEVNNREAIKIRELLNYALETQRINEETLKRKGEMTHRNENKRERVQRFEGSRRDTERDTTRRSQETREPVRNDKQFNENKKQASRNHEQRNYQMKYAVIPNKSGFRENNYTQKPSVVLKNVYIILGQGVMLAYIIAKTLNGKASFKNQLPDKLRQTMETICF